MGAPCRSSPGGRFVTLQFNVFGQQDQLHFLFFSWLGLGTHYFLRSLPVFLVWWSEEKHARVFSLSAVLWWCVSKSAPVFTHVCALVS